MSSYSPSVFPEQSACLFPGPPKTPTICSLLSTHLPRPLRARKVAAPPQCQLWGSPCEVLSWQPMQISFFLEIFWEEREAQRHWSCPVFWEAAFFFCCCFQATWISLQILKWGVILRRRLRNGNLSCLSPLRVGGGETTSLSRSYLLRKGQENNSKTAASREHHLVSLHHTPTCGEVAVSHEDESEECGTAGIPWAPDEEGPVHAHDSLSNQDASPPPVGSPWRDPGEAGLLLLSRRGNASPHAY